MLSNKHNDRDVVGGIDLESDVDCVGDVLSFGPTTGTGFDAYDVLACEEKLPEDVLLWAEVLD